MAPHSSTVAWKIPWTEKPGRLQSMGSHRVGHDWSDLAAAVRIYAAGKRICRDPTLPSLWNLYLCLPGCSLALPGMGICSSKAPPRVPLDPTPRLSLCHHSSVKFDQGLPWWLNGRESTCQCRGRGFDPWVRKISWRRKWQSTPEFLLGKYHRREPGRLQSMKLQKVRTRLTD